MNINGREITTRLPPYIVAELSCNHGGNISKAMQLIDAAVKAGADAIKLQTFEPADLTTPEHAAWDLYTRAKTPREWHKPLFEYADQRGITAFSSPFSPEAVAFLELECDPPCYKIASPEALRGDIIDAARMTGKPLIVSTGALHEAQVRELDSRLFPNVCFLHCIAHYPAKLHNANLKAIRTLRQHTELVGLSDHTPGYAAPIVATALGAVMIEKHIKLDDDCIDAGWSLDPDEFALMAHMVSETWSGLGSGAITPSCGPRAAVIDTWFENERLRRSA